MKPEYVYVASSWRCPMQPAIIHTLQAAGIDHYDFRHPTQGDDGFHWHDVMPSYHADWSSALGEQRVPVDEYLKAIADERSEEGFAKDFSALQRASHVVLVLPCGRSAHLELGWAVGAGKQTAVLLEGEDGFVVPELMYKMVDFITPRVFDLLGWLGVED